MPIVLIGLVIGGLLSLAYFSMSSPTPQTITDVDERDIEALARMIASETRANDKPIIKIAVCWVCKNEAERKGKTVHDLVMPGGVPSGQNTGGRFVSTRNSGTDEGREIARQVMSGEVSDPTNNSIQFDSPVAQRAALARNVLNYSKTPEQIAESRMNEGKEMVGLPGISTDYIRFWRYA